MPFFTIETTYHLPVFRHQTFEAVTPNAACRLAVADDDWSCDRHDYDGARETYVSGIWRGSDAAYRGQAIPVASRFDETVRRKADHFDALLALLKEPARPLGLSRTEFERWLPRAMAVIAEAQSVVVGLDDELCSPSNSELFPEDGGALAAGG